MKRSGSEIMEGSDQERKQSKSRGSQGVKGRSGGVWDGLTLREGGKQECQGWTSRRSLLIQP